MYRPRYTHSITTQSGRAIRRPHHLRDYQLDSYLPGAFTKALKRTVVTRTPNPEVIFISDTPSIEKSSADENSSDDANDQSNEENFSTDGALEAFRELSDTHSLEKEDAQEEGEEDSDDYASMPPLAYPSDCKPKFRGVFNPSVPLVKWDFSDDDYADFLESVNRPKRACVSLFPGLDMSDF